MGVYDSNRTNDASQRNSKTCSVSGLVNLSLWPLLMLSLDWNFVRDDRTIHNCILEWFLDYPGPSHPFSIHNIVSAGSYFNVKAGDWLSPSIIAHILKYVKTNE